MKSTPASPAVGCANASSSSTSSRPSAAEWKELAIVKSPKIVQCSVGHDGQHSLLVADDGSVFFVGAARRGEDGDSSGSLCKYSTLRTDLYRTTFYTTCHRCVCRYVHCRARCQFCRYLCVSTLPCTLNLLKSQV